MSEPKFSNIERLLHIIASIVGIANFLFSIGGFLPKTFLSVPEFPKFGFPALIIAFILIEGILAHAFGRIMTLLYSIGEGLPKIFVFIIGFISSWTSLFNIQWILIGEIPKLWPWEYLLENFWYLFKYSILTWLALSMAIYMIHTHMQNSNFDDEDTNSCMIIQGVGFAIIFIYSIVQGFK